MVSGRAGAGCAAVAGGGIVTFAVALAVLAGALDGHAGATGEHLEPGSVPPRHLPWILRAATLCPSVTAPLLAAQIDNESAWDPDAVSPVGAEGIAQFMPGTWPQWAADADGDGTTSPFDPPDAIMAAGRYDCALAEQTAAMAERGEVVGDSVDLWLAAYNAGAGAVARAHGIPPYSETQNYIRDIRELALTKYSEVGTGDVAAGEFGARVVAAAGQWIGRPYVWGGGDTMGPTGGGFDCSGLVLHAVHQASEGAITLPHRSQIQVTLGTAVDPARMAPGDAIGWALGGTPGDWDHIGIYLGNGRMIHAPKPGDHVKESDIATDAYYAPRLRSGAIKVRRYG